MDFISPLLLKITSYFDSDDDEEEQFECKNSKFQKLKFIDYEINKLEYTADYEVGVIGNSVIFLEIELAMDPFKTISIR